MYHTRLKFLKRPLRVFRLNVVQGRFDALMTLETIPVVTFVPGPCSTVLAQILGLRPEELQRLALQFGGWAIGQCPIPVKNIITETRHTCALSGSN